MHARPFRHAATAVVLELEPHRGALAHDIEAGHARGGKLNRERESVDAAADLSEETVGTLSVERTARTRASIDSLTLRSKPEYEWMMYHFMFGLRGGSAVAVVGPAEVRPHRVVRVEREQHRLARREGGFVVVKLAAGIAFLVLPVALLVLALPS